MRAASVCLLPRFQCFVCAILVFLAGIPLIARPAVAQSTTPPYYPSGTYTPFSTFEAVNPDGSSAFSFPSDGSPITMMGIVLNNPAEMLDNTPAYNTTPGNLGGQWQIFIQVYSDSIAGGSSTDFGGCEVWMAQCYGNLGFINDPNDIYTNSQWTAQLARLDSPTLISTGNTVALQAGDVVAITGYGLKYEGMVNINEQHMINNSFTITALETGVPLPAPTVTTLSQLQDSAGNFYFDPTRQTGAEHLQGTLVQLDEVRVLSGTWAPNRTVVITDGSLRQMILNIGNNPNLTTAPSGAFNVAGVEDQESTDGSNQDGYTLWLSDSADVTPLPNSGATLNWTGSSGSWNAAGNWSLGAKPQNPGDVAILGGSLAVAATVTLDGPQKAGSLVFFNTNPATTGYTLAPGTGGTLTLDNSGATALVTVFSGSHAITAPLALADNLDASVAVGSSLSIAGGVSESSPGTSLTEDGGGLLFLSGTNSYSGGTTVDAGTLLVTDGPALPAGGSLTVGAGGTLIFDPSAVAAGTIRSVASQITAVPEPGTMALLAVAIGGCLIHCHARRKDLE